MKPFFYFICIILLIAAIVAWIGLIIGLFKTLPLSSFIVAGPTAVSYMTNGLVFLILGIPLAFVVANLLKWVFKTQFPRNIKRGLGGVWGITLLILFSFAMWTAREFSTAEQVTETVSMESVTGDELLLNLESASSSINRIDHFGRVAVSNDVLYFPGLKVKIEHTTDPHFSATIQKSARGMNASKARARANQFDIPFRISENTIEVYDRLNLDKGSKWRDHEAELTIHVPEGKFIRVEGNSYYINADLDRNKVRPNKLSGYTWEMTADGLICPAYIEEMSYQETRELESFDQLNINGHMITRIEKSDQNQLVLQGPKKWMEQIEISQLENRLSIIQDKNNHKEQIEISVYTSELMEINLANTDEVHISGFAQDAMHITAKNHHDVDMYVDVKDLSLDLDGNFLFKIKGIGETLKANLDGYVRLDAGFYNVQNADVQGSKFRKSKVNVTNELSTAYPHKIEVIGNPQVIVPQKNN